MNLIKFKLAILIFFFNGLVYSKSDDKDLAELANYYKQIGKQLEAEQNYEKSLEYYNAELRLTEQTSDELGRAEALYRIAHIFYLQNKYNESLDYFYRDLEEAKQIGSKYQIYRIYSNIGLILGLQERYNESMGYFLKALILAKKIQASDLDDLLLSLGTASFESKHFRFAFHTITKALEIRKKHMVINDSRITDVLIFLGYSYARIGNCEAALEKLNEAFELMTQQIRPHFDDNIVPTFTICKNYDDLLKFGQKELKVRKEDENYVYIYKVNKILGAVLSKLGRTTESLDYILKAISLTKKALIGQNELATLLIIIADLYVREQQYDLAMEYLNQTLEIGKQLDNTKIRILLLFGTIYAKKLDCKNGFEKINESLELMNQSHVLTSNRDENIAEILIEIGFIYLECSRFDKALEFNMKALEIYEHLDDEKFGLYYALKLIGYVFYKQEQYTKALGYYNRALIVARKLLPGDDIRLVDLLKKLAEVHRIKNQYGLLIKYLNEAIAIKRKNTSPNDKEMSMLLLEKYTIIGKCTFSVNLFEKVFETQSFSDSESIYLLQLFGFVYLKCRRFQSALEKFYQGFEICKKLENYAAMAEMYNLISIVYGKQSMYEEELDYLNKAIALKEHVKQYVNEVFLFNKRLNNHKFCSLVP